MWEFGVGVAAAVVLAAGPPSPLPERRDLDGQPCNLPVSDALTACPDPVQPPVTCVLPVRRIPPGAITPCPDWFPDPRGRTVPVSR